MSVCPVADQDADLAKVTSRMNDRSLVARATAGELTPREVHEIALTVEDGSNIYQGLLVIGRADARDYRELVEQFLCFRSDPMIARLALLVLCGYWNMAAEYLHVLRQFIQKVDWDPDDDVRLMAMSCAGEFLRTSLNKSLMQDVLEVFQREGEPQTVREVAYRSLARAVGMAYNDLPSAARHFDLNRDTDPRVLARVHDLLREDCVP